MSDAKNNAVKVSASGGADETQIFRRAFQKPVLLPQWQIRMRLKLRHVRWCMGRPPCSALTVLTRRSANGVGQPHRMDVLPRARQMMCRAVENSLFKFSVRR